MHDNLRKWQLCVIILLRSLISHLKNDKLEKKMKVINAIYRN